MLEKMKAVMIGLAGALYGYDSIPIEWRKKLIKREYIEDMCQTASEMWSQINWLKKLNLEKMYQIRYNKGVMM